jgi:hypothetical protein
MVAAKGGGVLCLFNDLSTMGSNWIELNSEECDAAETKCKSVLNSFYRVIEVRAMMSS